MLRSTSFSAYFSHFRAGSASALVLAIALSCSDATSPNGDAGPALKYIEILVPDSLKNSLAPSNAMGNVVVGNSQSVGATHLSSLSADVPAAAYVKSKPDFAGMEAAPTNRITLPPAPGGNDGYVPDVPLGFDFKFYGTSYDKLNVFANGLVTFGTANFAAIQARLGYFSADRIPDAADPSNMIALAWSDWSPSRAGLDAIRYETRGTAPNRRFILQYTNVPEFGSFALMTVQLVLNEGSNDITIYTPTMSTTRSVDLITQGVENAAGTEATFDSTFHPILLEWYPRVRGFYKLTNDAVRFTPAHVNAPPVVVPPPSISTTTAPPALVTGRVAFAESMRIGSCFAIVNPGSATAIDDGDGVSITSARSDGAALDASFPKGVTTITWTATDADGVASSAPQTVTVTDNEKPFVMAPAAISARTDRGKNTATVATGEASVEDNCAKFTVDAARSDGAVLSAPFSIGTTTITYTATDESGNTSSANQSVEVHGNLSPVITAPASFAVNTDASVCNAIANPGVATVVDDAEGSIVEGRRSDGALLGAAYPKGSTSILWTATDADGMTASATQTVTVNDAEKPSVEAPADMTSNTAPGRDWAMVAVSKPSARDNCSSVSVDGSRSDGAALDAAYRVGSTTITWLAKDPAGNSATVTQRVNVTDRELPVISVPADMRVNATSPSGAIVNYTVLASDNVGGAEASCVPASGTMFPVGPTTVNCSVSDAAGNRATASFDVEVVGPKDQMLSLTDYVISLNLSNGTSNPLVNQLRAAFRSEDDATSCKKLSDFIDMVGKKASSIPQSTYIIREARRIMGAIPCS